MSLPFMLNRNVNLNSRTDIFSVRLLFSRVKRDSEKIYLCCGLRVQTHRADAAAVYRPELPSTRPSLRPSERWSTTIDTSSIVEAVWGLDISVK